MTRRHWDLLRHHNPDCDCVAVWCDDGVSHGHLDGATEVRCTFECGSNWTNADLVLRQWYLDFGWGLGHRRYVWVEYETLCTVPFREWYADVWDADLAASYVHTVRSNPNQYWLGRSAPFVPWHWAERLTTVSPLNAVLVSRRALAAYAGLPVRESIYCEVRLATTLRVAGFDLSPLPPAQALANGWANDGVRRDLTQPGVWHPVKG